MKYLNEIKWESFLKNDMLRYENMLPLKAYYSYAHIPNIVIYGSPVA